MQEALPNTESGRGSAIQLSHCWIGKEHIYNGPWLMGEFDKGEHYTEKWVAHGHGRDIVLDDSNVDELRSLDVDVTEYHHFCTIRATIGHLFDGLPWENPLKTSIQTALSHKNLQLIEAAQYIYKDPSASLSIDDIHKGQRDLTFMLYSITGILGAADDYDLLTDYASRIYPDSFSPRSSGGCEAVYQSLSNSLMYEGDLAHIPPDEHDYIDTYPYEGEVRVHISPDRRIEFTYTPRDPDARQRHMSTTNVTKDGKHMTYHADSISLRLDLDPTAPHGIALDVGRSPHSGDSLTRDGDLLGTIFAYADPVRQCHEYTGFDSDSAQHLRNLAEQITLQQSLAWKHHQENHLTRSALRTDSSQSSSIAA